MFLVGFQEDELLQACCGSGDNDYNFNISQQCGSKGVRVCSNPRKRVSWDGVHLTERAYQLMANWLLKHITDTTTLFQSYGRISLGRRGALPHKDLPLSLFFSTLVLQSPIIV